MWGEAGLLYVFMLLLFPSLLSLYVPHTEEAKEDDAFCVLVVDDGEFVSGKGKSAMKNGKCDQYF